MKLKTYVLGMLALILFSFFALVMAINYIDPDKSGIAGKILFFLVLFFFLSGFFNLLLLWARKKFLGNEAVLTNISLSLRQGILLSVFIVGILILQGLKLLVWWNGLLMLAGAFLIELYFLSQD